MRSLTPCFLLFAATCGSDPNALLVTLTNVPSRADKVEVSATLAGTAAMESTEITNPIDRFGVRFDAAATGHLRLTIKALDSDDCAQAEGELEFDLPSDFASKGIQLNTLSPRHCGKGTLPGCAANNVCAAGKVGNNNLESFWASSPSDIWAVGRSGALVHFDGTSWTPYDWGSTPAPTQDFYGIWGSSATDIWAVGAFGSMLRFDGTKWTQRAYSTSQTLNAIWGVSDSSIWAVGTAQNPGTDQGTFLHWDGSSWSPVIAAGTWAFNGVWADNSSGSNLIYACGDHGLLVRYDASQTPAWSEIISNTTVTLNGIWGTRSSKQGQLTNTLFAVGAGGIILRIHYGDSSPGWTTLTKTGTTLTLYGVRGDDTKNLVYAYGQNGAVVSAALDSSDTFTAQTSGLTSNIYGAGFSSGSLIWLGGNAGSLGIVDLNP